MNARAFQYEGLVYTPEDFERSRLDELIYSLKKKLSDWKKAKKAAQSTAQQGQGMLTFDYFLGRPVYRPISPLYRRGDCNTINL
ncbi:MAG: hypothetical protein KTR35_19375 [Gammaproteobacteria bacterium]|nr:hypothetical protein [Gammaproteobacteria bacterium]